MKNTFAKYEIWYIWVSVVSGDYIIDVSSKDPQPCITCSTVINSLAVTGGGGRGSIPCRSQKSQIKVMPGAWQIGNGRKTKIF